VAKRAKFKRGYSCGNSSGLAPDSLFIPKGGTKIGAKVSNKKWKMRNLKAGILTKAAL